MFEESIASIPSIWASMNSWFTPTVLFVLLNLMIGTIAITSSLGTSQKHQNNNEHHQQQDHHPRPHPQLVRSPSMLQRLKSINFYASSYRSPEPTSQFAQPTSDFNTHFVSNFQQQQQQTPGPDPEPEPHQPRFTRSPSMLQRLKSINLYNYLSQDQEEEQNQPTPPPTATATGPTTTDTTSDVQETHESPETHYEEEEENEEPTLEEVYSQLQSGTQVSRTKSDTMPASGEMPPKLPKKMRKSASVKSAFSHFEEDDVNVMESRRPATVREGKVSGAMAEADDEEVDAKADDFINKFKQQLKLQRIDSIIRYKEMIGRGSGR